MFAEWFASKALSPLAIKLATTFFAFVKEPAGKKIDEIKVSLQFGFDNYIRKEINRYSKVKTILGVNVPLDIQNIYVNLYVHLAHARITGSKDKVRSTAIRDDDLLKIAERDKRIVITGTAGAGKSMLMKYLFLQTLSQFDSALPVFIELRELNDRSDLGILECINEKIRLWIENFTLEQTLFALKEGIIILFLDGFDEIDYDTRRKKSREIVQIGNQYDKLTIYLSSRPDDVFRGWDRFYVYNVVQLSKGQLELLVNKIPYDDELKTLFLRKLNSGLYESHKEFLVNPLLAIMMLITLEQFSEIPAKIHLFYEYAFEALFVRHDSTKSGGFQRKRHVTLPLDDYRRLFSYFCTISYLRELFRFDHSVILDILARSIMAAQIEVDKQNMLDDLVNCTCMISRDGLDYVFSHRSFQEYFTAYFVARVKSEEMGQVVPKLIARGRNDNVLFMMSEMNRENFEKVWVLPELKRIWNAIMNVNPETQLVDFIYAIQGNKDARFLVERRWLTVKDRDEIFWSGYVGPLAREEATIMYSMYLIHKIYNIFATIRERVTGFEDKKIVNDIADGVFLENDERFQPIRDFKKRGSAKNDSPFFEFRARKADNVWLRRTFYSKVAAGERLAIKELLDAVEARVDARNDGLSDILGLR